MHIKKVAIWANLVYLGVRPVQKEFLPDKDKRQVAGGLGGITWAHRETTR